MRLIITICLLLIISCGCVPSSLVQRIRPVTVVSVGYEVDENSTKLADSKDALHRLAIGVDPILEQAGFYPVNRSTSYYLLPHDATTYHTHYVFGSNAPSSSLAIYVEVSRRNFTTEFNVWETEPQSGIFFMPKNKDVLLHQLIPALKDYAKTHFPDRKIRISEHFYPDSEILQNDGLEK